MTKVEIFAYTENPVLLRPSQPVPQADIGTAKLNTLIADMRRLLSKEKNGVALAAPQVGVPLRLFIVSGKAIAKQSNSTKNREEDSEEDMHGLPTEDQVYINPILLKLSRAKSPKHEGCLSVRGKWGIVPRAEKALIRAQDETGRTFTRGASGFLAHVFQHEMDHLEGILYTEKATHLYDDNENDHEHESDE